MFIINISADPLVYNTVIQQSAGFTDTGPEEGFAFSKNILPFFQSPAAIPGSFPGYRSPP
jgi:hypothetical protein